MKAFFMMCLLAAAAQQMSAEGMKTAGDGTTYTLDLLSQTEGSGVEKHVDENYGQVIYILSANDTIAAGDKFVMEDNVSVLFGDNAVIILDLSGHTVVGQLIPDPEEQTGTDQNDKYGDTHDS